MTVADVASTAAVARTVAEFTQDPTRFTGLSGVPDYVARRLPGWAVLGVDVGILAQTVRAGRICPATPEWVAAFGELGDQQAEAARRATKRGEADRAKSEFLAASFWYFVARWPSPGPGRSDAWDAYARHRAAYLAASRHFDHPFDVVTVPYEDAEFVGYLHRVPGDSSSAPLAVVCGGIDVWKSDLAIHAIAESLVRRGTNVFAIDIPGTGQSPVRPGAGALRTFGQLIDHLRDRRDVDGRRLGIVGLSFGGYWATSTGLTDPRVRAVVNIGGPLHYAFQSDWLEQLSPATLRSLANSLGLAPGHHDAMVSSLRDLSLVACRLLDRPHRPAFLAVNGARDEQVPIADLNLLTEHDVTQDTLVFGDDRHCASYSIALHLPFVAAWLAMHLQEPAPGR
jgi:esterase FrsA